MNERDISTGSLIGEFPPEAEKNEQSGGILYEEVPYSRRDFLKGSLGLATVSLLLAACGGEFGEKRFPRVRAYSREFPEYDRNLPRVWGASELASAWQERISMAEKSGQPVELELPHGEIFIDEKLTLELPKGVELRIKAHQKGTRIRGSEALSEHPGSYGARQNNVLEIGLREKSKVSFEGVYFHGGSRKAGGEGYKAPPGPWNAVVAIYGRGPGDGLENRGAKPKGGAEFINCHAEQSEAPGFMVQNLNNFKVEGCTTRNTDCLVTTNWCQAGEIKECYGKNVLSDFVFGVWSEKILVENCGVNLAWIGYNFRSCRGVKVKDCYAGYCLAAASSSEVERYTNEQTVGISFENFHTYGSSCVYAFQHADKVWLVGGVHDRLGEVLNAEKFISRVSNPELIAKEPVYLGPNVGEIVSDDLYFRKSDKAPDNYKITSRLPGSMFYGFDEAA